MSHQLDYLADSALPAGRVFAAMVDPDCLRARLAELGGRNAALLEHEVDADSARFRVRHGLATQDLPPAIRPFLPADFSVERQETWLRKDDGRYEGEATVAVPGTPASASSRMLLVDKGQGSELKIRTDVNVKVPLIGGMIESSVGDQINNLLGMETEFTLNWARTHAS